MTPRRLATLALILATTISATAQIANRNDLRPPAIRYTLTVLDDLETLQVDLEVDDAGENRTHVAMPNWSPGAYRLGSYGDNVRDMTVRDAATDAPLEALRIDPHTWSIDTSTSRRFAIRYRLEPGRRRFSRQGRDRVEPTGIHFQGPSTFAYVVGAKEARVQCRYVLPEGWKIANGLMATDDASVRWAKDYDTFIDAPTIVGVFERRDFEIDGTPFSCVYWDNAQQYEFDLDAFTDVCRRICHSQGSLFGSFPFDRYVFLFSVSAFGGGGLEHLNSTSIGLRGPSMKNDIMSGASVTSHEFFHTWNVKRIRPVALGPFEYEHENYTGNLWVSEGWTSYYGDLTLARAGLIAPDELLRKMSGYIRRELNKERRKEHSVYWASRNVWHRATNERELGPRVDYYAKGELLGMLIDLEIRAATDNGKSLDDVMRFMNRWFAERGVGFEEGDVERACTAISNHDFREFFARHVRGTLDPPFAEILAKAGLSYSEDRIEADLPFSWAVRDGKVQVSRLRSPEDKSDLQRGDVILAFDGKEVSDLQDYLRTKSGGERVALRYERDGEPKEAEILLEKRLQIIPHLDVMPNAPERAVRIRESWLSGK